MDKFSKLKVQNVDLIKPKSAFIALIMLMSTTLGFVGGWIGSNSRDRQQLINNEGQGREVVLSENQAISKIAKSVGESVVSVNVISQSTSNDFFGFGRPIEQQSAGTGFIISKDGVVITNRHVIPRGAETVSVTLSDGTELTDVKVIGRTTANDPLDVAFLKINDSKGKKLKAAPLGDSGKMEVGFKVIAIGNALGQFQNSVTSGILSGYGRSVQAADEASVDTLQNLFQTDAAINQGNSGGPLVNINGEVIGINTAVAGSAENIGFAIPINDVKGSITSILESGKLQRPYLGVRYVQLTDDYAYQYNLDAKRGAYIVPGSRGQQSILPSSPAAKAGLQEKDIITHVNGEPIDERNSLPSLIGRHKVGDEISLTIIRDGKEQQVKVRLEAAPED